MKVDVKLRLSDNFLSTEASYFWDCLTKPGGVDFRIFPTSWIKLRPQGGAVTIIPIRYGEDFKKMLITLSMPPGVLPSTPLLLTCRGVLDIHVPPDTASATLYFISGIRSVCGINLIAAIPGFVGRGKTGMDR